MSGKVIGGELGRHAAPAEGEPRTDHRHLGARVAEHAQRVGHEARQRECGEHHGDRQLLGCVGRAAWRREQAGADHADHDRADRHVLIAPRVLAQHPLREQHQHEQSSGQRRLHDDQRREQQRQDL